MKNYYKSEAKATISKFLGNFTGVLALKTNLH